MATKRILIAVLVVVVAAAATWLFSRRDIPPNQLLLRLDPSKAVVVSFDVQALRRSGLLELIAGSAGAEEPEYKQFVTQTGFDYRKDLDSALLGFRNKQSLLYLRGRFDFDKLSQYAIKNGGSCAGGRCSMTGSVPDRQIAFTKLRPGLLAMSVGSEQGTLLEMRKGVPSGPSRPIPQQPLWAWIPASIIDNQASMPPGTRAFANSLRGAEHIELALGPDANRFAVTLQVIFKQAPDAAVAVSELERTTAMLTKLIARENQTPNPKDFSGVLTAGKFKREDRTVLGSWPIERVFLETLTRNAP